MHNDYPLAPEHLVLDGSKKLTPNLQNKTNYLCHIKNLQFYLKNGLILSKVHNVISFHQSRWLHSYIDSNSKKRQKATNKFETQYFKDKNNSFFGKTMKDVRGRQNIQFCLNEDQFVKHTNSPLLDSIKVIKENGLSLVKILSN